MRESVDINMTYSCPTSSRLYGVGPNISENFV